MKDLAAGVLLYRNHDIALTRLLNKVSARRQIRVEMDFSITMILFALRPADEDGNRAEVDWFHAL